MKIIFLVPSIKSGSGGSKAIYRLCQYLQKIGADPWLYAYKLHAYPPFNWVDQNPSKFPIINLSIVEDKSFPKDTDVVINFGDGDPFLEIPNGAKKVLFLQGFGTQDETKEKLNLTGQYAGVICTSKWLAGVAKVFGHSKIFIVPPGIDPRFKQIDIQKSKVNVIGSLYHTSKEKNFDLFVEGFNLFKENYPKIPIKPIVLTARRGEQDLINFFDTTNECGLLVNPPQYFLTYLYNSCAVWISPSKNEGFGLTTLEAMSCGCPTLVYPNYGLDEYLIHKENCLIIKKAKDISDGLFLYFSDDSFRNKVVKNGLKLASQFTWERAAKEFLDALEQILK